MAENNKDYNDGNYNVTYSDGKWSINGYALCPDSVEPATDAEDMQHIIQQNPNGIDYILKQAQNIEPGENGCIFDSFGDFWSVATTEQYSLENGENGFDFMNQGKQDRDYDKSIENIETILAEGSDLEGILPENLMKEDSIYVSESVKSVPDSMFTDLDTSVHVSESVKSIPNPTSVDLDASLDTTYDAYGQSPYEATKDKGFGEGIPAIFVCKDDSPEAIKNGYRALLAYQESTNEAAGMIVDKYIVVPGNLTERGAIDYTATMCRHFGDGCMLFPSDKKEAWYKCCNEQMNNGTNGCNLDNATEIAVALAEDKPFDEVARKLNNLDFADGSKDDVMSIVTEFAPKGQEFADYLQQSGHGPKGRGDEDIVKDETQNGHDDDQPGGN